MLKALIDGDIRLFEKMLRKVVLAVFSYHDLPMKSNPTASPATAGTTS
jgi:hypothetical protein